MDGRFSHLFELVCILYVMFRCLDLVLNISILGESEVTHEVLQLYHQPIHHLEEQR